jgi:hypothetical protein
MRGKLFPHSDQIRNLRGAVETSAMTSVDSRRDRMRPGKYLPDRHRVEGEGPLWRVPPGNIIEHPD